MKYEDRLWHDLEELVNKAVSTERYSAYKGYAMAAEGVLRAYMEVVRQQQGWKRLAEKDERVEVRQASPTKNTSATEAFP